MNVRTLCLSILQSQEASGYEIRKLCVDGEYSHFVEASFGSIYPALAKLEDEGLVTSRVEHQSGRPSKKIYAITPAGRDAFIEALKEPLGNDVLRSPFLLFASCAHMLDADLVKTRIKDQLRFVETKIEELRELERTSSCCAAAGASYASHAWVIRYVLACLQVAQDHLHTHMDALIATADDESAAAQAAQ